MINLQRESEIRIIFPNDYIGYKRLCWLQKNMNLVTILFIIVSFLILITTPLNASTNQSTLTTVFNKGLDNDFVESRLSLQSSFTNGRLMTCDEVISLKVHQVSGYGRQWKVDQKLMLEYAHPVNKKLILITNSSLKRFYDLGSSRSTYFSVPVPEIPFDSRMLASFTESNSSPLITDISTYYITQGVKFNYSQDSNVKGIIGPLFDRRKNINDNGYHLELGLNHELEEASFTASGWFERLKAGSEHGLSADLNGKYSFLVEGLDTYEMSFQRNQRGEYNLASGNRGYRRDEVFNLSNHLINDIDAPLQVSWDSNLSNQITSHTGLLREYKDREFTWQNEIGTNIILSGFRTGLSAGLDIQEQRYDEAIAQGRRNFVNIKSTTKETFLDSVSVNAQITKYQYDTPDINDFNDRDELRYLISFKGAKKLTSDLGLLFGIETNLHHLVYIYAKRSAENRWDRSFSLSCELPWQRRSFKNNCRFAVVSTYTVYDFPVSDTDMSRVYRFFTAEDSLSIDLSKHFRLDCSSSLLLDEHGRFRWTEWKEDVSEDGYSFSGTLTPVYHNGNIALGIGWETHQRYSWQHQSNGSKVSRESVRSHGPVMFLKSTPSPKLYITMSSSVLHVNDRFRGSYNLPEINCSLTWTF
jgi:hypothetical protein